MRRDEAVGVGPVEVALRTGKPVLIYSFLGKGLRPRSISDFSVSGLAAKLLSVNSARLLPTWA
jgi:hypothetical protein